MLYSIIKENTYQDSINLMLLSKSLLNISGIKNVTVMMGTDANKDIMKNSNLFIDELKNARNNDMCCVIDSDEDLREVVKKEIELFFKKKNNDSKKEKIDIIHSLNSIDYKLPNANIALVSIPGKYVYKEAIKLLKKNINVMIFSDNVTIEEEKKIKEFANEKNLIVMGPDCGTTIIQGIPFAFANNLEKGDVGIIGASGTGIQEISTGLSNEGIGITHAIGLGGRDLSEKISGISAIKALELLEMDNNTEIIVFVSKPPAKKVMDIIIEKLKKINKPIVGCFLGESRINEEGIFYEKTLSKTVSTVKKIKEIIKFVEKKEKKIKLLGLYCGGTLANEAAIIINEKLNIAFNKSHEKGIMLKTENLEIIDLGDDFYTQGRPHPMIEPSIREEILNFKIKEKDFNIVLLDNVIGYGANDEMARFTKKMAENNKEILFITSITGTTKDFQNREKELEILKSQPNIFVAKNNEEAVEYSLIALNLMEKINSKKISNNTENILNSELNIINVGISKFIKGFKENDAKIVQFNWKPVANGDEKMEKILEELE